MDDFSGDWGISILVVAVVFTVFVSVILLTPYFSIKFLQSIWIVSFPCGFWFGMFCMQVTFASLSNNKLRCRPSPSYG